MERREKYAKNVDPNGVNQTVWKRKSTNSGKRSLTNESDSSPSSTLKDVGASVLEQTELQSDETPSSTTWNAENADANEIARHWSQTRCSSDSVEATLFLSNRNGTRISALLQSMKIEPEIFIEPIPDRILCRKSEPSFGHGDPRVATRTTYREWAKYRSVGVDPSMAWHMADDFAVPTPIKDEYEQTLCHKTTGATTIESDPNAVSNQQFGPLPFEQSQVIDDQQVNGERHHTCNQCQLLTNADHHGPIQWNALDFGYAGAEFIENRPSQEGLLVSSVELEECEQWLERFQFAQL